VPRLLLAEDDDGLRPLLAERFRAEGFEVVEAEDGSAVVEYLAESIVQNSRHPGFDLIVSDIRLPGLNALDVLRGARGALEATPVILITAFGDQRTHDRALLLGASAVFDKPLDVDDLIDAAYRLLTVPRGTA
jgi:two-component system, response regulator, stage 0 sporulation protein F